MRDGALRMSATGPGKPYWKTPAGSTGGRAGSRCERGIGAAGTGTGGAGAVRDVVEVEVVVVAMVFVAVSLGLLMP